MAQFTEHYGLHQWEPEDNFQREDFNGDFEKIDTAIEEVNQAIAQVAAEKCAVVLGSYTGRADVGDSSPYGVELGCVPKALFYSGNPGFLDGTLSPMGFLLYQGQTMYQENTAIARLNGSRLEVANRQDYSAYLNLQGRNYFYMALV